MPHENGNPDLLSGRRVAFLVTQGFEQIEMTSPRQALDDAGAKMLEEFEEGRHADQTA